MTNYRDFSEDSTSIISQDDATLNGDSDDSSRMSSASVSTIKDDTLVSSITIATPFTNDTAPVTRNLSKPHIPLSFLGITKKHRQIADGSTQPSSSGNQVSSTTPESKLYKEENVTQKEDSCLIEAMESHSAMISTPTNETTGHVYNFTNSQFGTGMMSDQRLIKTDASNSNLGVGNMMSAQQQQIIIPSADLIQQQKIIQHNLKQIHIQSQENASQLCPNINQDTLVDASAPGPSSLNTLTNKGEFEASKLPVAKESNVLGAHQASQTQEPVQPVSVPTEKCKYSIANAESEVASISIKLPPSILSNQDRLESIVNTINKAITTPPATQKDSQQAAEMLASININSAINSPPQQQQQVFAQNAIQTQQSPQPQAFTQVPNTMQIENNSTIVAENISSGNNNSPFNTQQLQSDQNNQLTENWGYEEDGADAKKIKVSPTEKEICDAAAVIATNAINNISSATSSTTTSIHQATPSQCFNEVSVPTVTVASNTWTNKANTSQNFNNPVLSGAQGATFVPSTAWEDESKNANKVKIIEVVPAQPAPTLSTAQTSSTNTTLDAVVAAANVTNAINAAAESLKGIAASSILDAQAATNALNAAAAAASATNSLNAATALAVASVTGNHESSIQNWAQTGNQNVLTNSSQISQHNFNAVEAPQTFSQPSNIWNGATEQANSPASKEQTTVWNNTAIQQQQGSFDSGSAIDFGSLNSSAAQTWSSKNDGASERRSGQLEQAQGIPTSDVWQTNDDLSPSYVSATNASNNYSTPPSSVWNTDIQDPKAAEQAKIANAPSNNAASTNSPGSLPNWHAVNSPESLGKVQESVHPQGTTFSPVSNWNEGGKDVHNSPAATSSHTNHGFSKGDDQQSFNSSPQVWNNQGGDGIQLKTASNINTDSQMWDLTQENSAFHAQNISKGKNMSISSSSELHQTQTLPSNTEETVGNSTQKPQTWESSSNNNEKQGNLTEDWNSPITNDPMLSETSVGVIQQQQKAEESWPSYNTNAKSDNQWSATVDSIHVSQQLSKSDWTSSFNQQPNSEKPSNDNSTWPTFSTSSKPDSGTIVQPVEQQEQQKEPQENWTTFTDQSTTKWQAQPQEIAGTTNKLGIGTVDAAKTGNWPSFDNACKNELQSCQPQANWNNFKIETGKETSDWKVVPNQQSSNSELSQPQQESTVQANNWTSSTQPQQQVPQEKWLENKESDKWLQGTNVSQQTTTTVNETWGATINIENKVQQSSASSSVNVWSESINSAETKQQQTWSLSAQQSVQSLPINVPSIASSDVRSVLNNDTHHPNMNSSEMLVVDPKDTSLSLEQSTSLKESTPMEVDTASYDNPLLTPNPTIH